MSLYKDASLVMIPSAYKDGKLYSIRPTDGSGDFTFSRGSNLAATRVDVNGLIEKGRENLILQSNQFDTTWASQNLTATGNQAGYDSSNNAWKLTPSTANTYHRIINSSSSVSASVVVTLSVYAKADGYNFIRVSENANSGDYATFNLSTGVVENNTSLYAKIESVGNGWYRCSSTITPVAIHRFDIYVMESANVQQPWTGDGTSGILVQDAQLELGLVATDYIETGTSAAQSGILEDMPRLDYSGSCPSLLLEPQRTNSLTSSEFFSTAYWPSTGTTIVSNDTTSPEGLNNATKLVESSNNEFHFIRLDTTIYIEATTFSFYAKAGERTSVSAFLSQSGNVGAIFDLSAETATASGTGNTASIESVGNDWYRCVVTNNGSADLANSVRIGVQNGALDSYQGDGVSGVYIWGAQLERSASYPTSYIPTYGSSVTRSGDNAVATHTIADTETLTYFSEFIAPERQSGGGEHLLENSSGSSRIRVYQNNSTTIRVRTDVPSANFDYTYSSLGISVGDVVKICLRVENGVMTAFINGVEKNTFAAATINFGKLHLRPQSIMNVDSTIIFPTALTDSECIALTTL